MPWHDVQFLKMTCRTGPCGGTTTGRAARPPICADAGTVSAAATNAAAAIHSTPRTLCTPRIFRTLVSDHFERLQPPGAGPDALHLDPVQMQEAEQHVRRALRVV